jgi:hypothetical protein
MTEKRKLLIGKLRGIEAVINAMSTHKDHSQVQHYACFALASLAINDGTSCVHFFFNISLICYAFFIAETRSILRHVGMTVAVSFIMLIVF